MEAEIQCVVSGKVQRVGYRDFVQRAALELGVVGYVENNTNGTVTVLAQGTPDTLKLFVSELHTGSPLSEVAAVGIDWQTPEKQFIDFVVIYT